MLAVPVRRRATQFLRLRHAIEWTLLQPLPLNCFREQRAHRAELFRRGPAADPGHFLFSVDTDAVHPSGLPLLHVPPLDLRESLRLEGRATLRQDLLYTEVAVG